MGDWPGLGEPKVNRLRLGHSEKQHDCISSASQSQMILAAIQSYPETERILLIDTGKIHGSVPGGIVQTFSTPRRVDALNFLPVPEGLDDDSSEPSPRFITAGSFTTDETCVPLANAVEKTMFIVPTGSRRVIIGGRDQTKNLMGHPIRVYDWTRQELLHLFVGHTEQVNDFAADDEHECFVSVSQDETIRVWDHRTAECENCVEKEEDPFHDLHLRTPLSVAVSFPTLCIGRGLMQVLDVRTLGQSVLIQNVRAVK